MKRWQKIVLGLIAAGGLALAGAAVALKILYPPERIKEIATGKLAKALGREIKLADASIGLGGVTLRELQISETPNFAAGTAASLQSLSVKIEWRPLLVEKEIRVRNISADGLSLKIVASQGKNAARAKKPADASKGAGGSGAGVPNVFLDRLSLTNGSVHYEDRATRTTIQVSDLALTASNAAPAQPFPLELSANVAYAETKGRFSFKGVVDPRRGDLDKAGVTIDAMTLVWDGKEFAFAGTLVPVSAPAGSLNVTLPAMEAGGIRIPSLGGTLHASYRDELVSLTKLNLTGDGASLRGAARQTKKGWRLEGLDAALGAIALTLDGAYTETALDLRLRSKRLDLGETHRWVAALKRMNASGTASVDVRLTGKPGSPSIAGTLTLAEASLTASGQALTGLAGEIVFTPKRLDAKLTGALNDAALDVSLGAEDYGGDRPKIELNGLLAKLDLTRLPVSKPAAANAPPDAKPDEAAQTPAPSTTAAEAKGSITIGAIEHPRFKASNTTLRWKLEGIGADLSKLDGTVSFSVGPGRFEELKQVGKTNPLVKVVLLPLMIIQKVAGLVKVPLFPKFDKVNFSEIAGDYSVTKGFMTVKRSHLAADIGDVDMSGTADLGKDALDLRVSAGIKAIGLKTPVAFKVTGPMSDPKVKLDAKAILKSSEVNKALKQGEKLLKGLFGR